MILSSPLLAINSKVYSKKSVLKGIINEWSVVPLVFIIFIRALDIPVLYAFNFN